MVNRQWSIVTPHSALRTPKSEIWRVGAFLLLLLLLALPASRALAQNYSFAVPELRMQVFVQPDASVRIVYDITFENFGSAIDVVDIGTPHRGYDLSNFSASVDGRALSDIRVSEYIDTGVEIHLDGATIPSGATGTLHVEFTMPDMVYEDTTQEGFASLQISPTWFESDLVRGNTDIWILVHMLPEVQPEEVLYQDVPFTDKVIFEEHVVVGWRWPDGQVTGPYNVGVSFPQRGMTRVIEQSLLDITRKWLEDNPAVSFILGSITFLLVGVAFFRFSGGTGISVFALLACGLVFLLFMNPLVSLVAWMPAVAFLIYVEKKRGKSKDTYLPAIAQVEGGGIKRGLTAPEAAVLLEMPLNKILLLIMFGLLDKKAVRLVDDSPLTVAVEKDYVVKGETATKRRKERREAAEKFGVVLRNYEQDVLDVLQDSPAKPVHKQDFNEAMKKLVESVVDKMKGFDLSDTQDYYKKIISRAMEEAGRMGEVPELEKYLDRTWPWIMMADDYGPVFRRGGYNYHPVWVRPYIGGGAAAAGGGKPSGPDYGGKTSFGDVAASFAGWTENTAGKLATSISPFGAGGGVVNLGGADKVTGDIFKALASSSGGSGGSSGGGCACACAGCACACACAGGGR